MADSVNHPQHYGGEDDPYEVIKVAEAWGFDKNAYLFNVLKYIRREKGRTLEDLQKARFYLDRLISRLEGGTRAKAGSKAHTKYVAVYTDGENDPFHCQGMYAHVDWTVENLASLIATQAGKPAGTYGIALGPDAAPFKSSETVLWMCENWPPDRYDFYLVKR